MPSTSLGAGRLKEDNEGSQPSGTIALEPSIMKQYIRRPTFSGAGSTAVGGFGSLDGGDDASIQPGVGICAFLG